MPEPPGYPVKRGSTDTAVAAQAARVTGLEDCWPDAAATVTVWLPPASLHGTAHEALNVPVLATLTVPSVSGVDSIVTVAVLDGANPEPLMSSRPARHAMRPWNTL